MNLTKEGLDTYIKEYLKENLTVDLANKDMFGYSNEALTVTLYLDGEEISSEWVSVD